MHIVEPSRGDLLARVIQTRLYGNCYKPVRYDYAYFGVIDEDLVCVDFVAFGRSTHKSKARAYYHADGTPVQRADLCRIVFDDL